VKYCDCILYIFFFPIYLYIKIANGFVRTPFFCIHELTRLFIYIQKIAKCFSYKFPNISVFRIQTRRLSAGPATVSKSPAGGDRRFASTGTLGRSSLDNQTTSTCPDRGVVARKNASAKSSLTGAALAGSAASQDPTPSSSGSATSCASSSSLAAHSPITWKLGTRLEAKDFMLKW